MKLKNILKNKISSDESNNSCSCTLKKMKKKVLSDKTFIEIRVKYPEEGFYYDITVLKIMEKLKEKPSDLSVLDNYEHKKNKKIIIPQNPYILKELNNIIENIAEFEKKFYDNFDFIEIIINDNKKIILLRSHQFFYLYELELEYLS